jgi:hypothetical protein
MERANPFYSVRSTVLRDYLVNDHLISTIYVVSYPDILWNVGDEAEMRLSYSKPRVTSIMVNRMREQAAIEEGRPYSP